MTKAKGAPSASAALAAAAGDGLSAAPPLVSSIEAKTSAGEKPPSREWTEISRGRSWRSPDADELRMAYACARKPTRSRLATQYEYEERVCPASADKNSGTFSKKMATIHGAAASRAKSGASSASVFDGSRSYLSGECSEQIGVTTASRASSGKGTCVRSSSLRTRTPGKRWRRTPALCCPFLVDSASLACSSSKPKPSCSKPAFRPNSVPPMPEKSETQRTTEPAGSSAVGSSWSKLGGAATAGAVEEDGASSWSSSHAARRTSDASRSA